MMLKNLFFILLICISSLANAQSSRQRLEDIEDKLDMMEYEKAIKDMQLEQERALRSIQRNSSPSKDLAPEPYRNNQSDAVRRKVAAFFNLPVSVYLKRDEIGELACEKYNNIPQIGIWTRCYQAKILDISYTEMVARRSKADAKCNSISDKPKQDICKRDIIVLDK
jgi:hypothetical protein